MADIDYQKVNQYWALADTSVFGPYLMDGFGFPASAGLFRFRTESKIVEQLIREVNHDGTVLDLGSGIGYWTEYFAKQFAKVVSVEGSKILYEGMKRRCGSYTNINAINGNVMSFEHEVHYAMVFLGGLLMYLNENEIISLLTKIVPSIERGGLIICRESTIRKGVITLQGEYQAVYRSVSTYSRIFDECGLSIEKIQINTPYVLMQMGSELIKKWKELVPKRFQCITALGYLTYWGLRLGYPFITRVPRRFCIAFPKLENHFFVLRVSPSK